jgi:hypothetical protein
MIGIYQNLRGISNASDCAVGMSAAIQREIGDSVEFKKIWACNLEKVGKQLVGSPLLDKSREIIKDVEYLPPSLFNYAVNLTREVIKARTGIKIHNFDTWIFIQYGLVRSKANVDALTSVGNRLVCERPHKVYVILKLIDLPDNVIPQAKSLNDFVKVRNSAVDWRGLHKRLRNMLLG